MMIFMIRLFHLVSLFFLFYYLVASFTEKNQKDCLQFDPDSRFKSFWDIFGLFCILYQVVVVPYRLCFNADADGVVAQIEQVIDISFMVDIFIQFNTGFYKKGNLITSRKLIVINYLQTWFFLDLAASFPYNIFLYDENIPASEDPLSVKNGNNNTQV